MNVGVCVGVSDDSEVSPESKSSSLSLLLWKGLLFVYRDGLGGSLNSECCCAFSLAFSLALAFPLPDWISCRCVFALGDALDTVDVSVPAASATRVELQAP